MSSEVLQIQQGSLYPALHRLERKGWIKACWGTSDNNRRAKYYEITRSGRRQLVNGRGHSDTGRLAVLSDILYRLRSLFLRSKVEHEMAEELEFHLQHEIERQLQTGADTEQARRKAKHRFRWR